MMTCNIKIESFRTAARVLAVWVKVLVVVIVPALVGPSVVHGQSTGYLGPSGTEALLPPLDSTFCVGYLDHPKGVVFDISTVDQVILGTVSVKQQLPVSGVYLSALTKVPVSDRVGIVVRGSYLVPSNRDALESATAATGAINHRLWDSEVQWWSLDAEAQVRGLGPISLIGGFRFDSYSMLLNNPLPAPFFPASLPTDQAELAIHSYIPYVGLLHSRNWATGSLSVSAIGFPFVPGSIHFGETASSRVHRWNVAGNFDRGYFVELSSEYTRRWYGLDMGCFAKFTNLSAAGPVDVEVLGANLQGMWDGVFKKTAWMVGAQVAVPFDSPF